MDNNFALGIDQFQIGAGMGLPSGGITSFEDFEAFAKAVNENLYQTDHANLTGVAALRVESLEPNLRAIVGRMESLTLYRALRRLATSSSLDEWMVQTSLGGQVDGVFNGPGMSINSERGEYERHTLRIKYLETMAQIPYVETLQKLRGIQLRAIENDNRMRALAIGANRALYHGDEDISPLAYDGIHAQLRKFDGGSHIVDMKGSSDANELATTFFELAAEVADQGNYGQVTDFYTDRFLQNDLDTYLFPQYRVRLDSDPSSVMLGAPVAGIKTSYGDILSNTDIWLNNNFNAKAAFAKNPRMPDGAPGTPTVVATPQAGYTGSRFTAARAGTYYVSVASVNEKGIQGIPSDPVSVTVAAGGAIKIVATQANDARATGGVVFISTQDPASAPAIGDLREAFRFPFQRGSNVLNPVTVYHDLSDIPGASSVALIRKDPEAIQVKQLLPATQFPLAATDSAVVRWAILLYMALQLGIPQHHYWIKGYVPKGARWKPFKPGVA